MPLPILVLLAATLASASESAECREGSVDDSCDHDQFSALQKLSSVEHAADELQAEAPTCPYGTTQVGEIGSDIDGCGLTGCFGRYELPDIDACLARCKANPECKAFTWSPDGTYPLISISVCTLYDRTESNRNSWGIWGTVILCKLGTNAPKPTPQPTPKLTPRSTPEPTPELAPEPESGMKPSLAISAIRLADDPGTFKKQQRTSEYRVGGDEVVARRCCSFSVVVTRSLAGLTELGESEADPEIVFEEPALMLQRLRRQDHTTDLDSDEMASPEDAAGKQRGQLQKRLAAAAAAAEPSPLECSDGRECAQKLKNLYLARDALDEKCGFPTTVPSSAIVDRFFCANENATCTKYFNQVLQCLQQRQPLERQIESCDACILEQSTERQPEAFVEGESAAGRSQEALIAVMQRSAKEAAWEESQDEERRAAKRRWLDMKADLFNWRGTPHRSNHSVVELVEVVSGNDEETAGIWPSIVSLVFKGAGGLSVNIQATRDQSDCGTTCTYHVNLPCNMPVGTGSVCSEGTDGKRVCGSKMHVIFNPHDSRDETYMSPADFSQSDVETYLKQETAGFWTGSANDNSAFTWGVDHFDSAIFEAAMKMVSMIPLEQRGSAPRVARWLVFLIGEEVLWGRWCSEPGCFDDGTKPGQWTGSKKIYEQWLETGKAVKYAQCWVFAGTTLSATRAVGFGSRQVTNFNSAHGHPPFNMGVDDFFTYDEKKKPTIVHANHKARPESIWNFHAWNEVWMKRNDLADVSADGWQVIDSTPQEKSCEQHGDGSETLCRYMVGPAPKRTLRNRQMDTEGGETKYNAVNTGLAYDSMFVFGETDGDWRGWRPKMVDWSRCDKKCTPDYRGDGFCDKECNNAECDWDMGDCCAETCQDRAGKYKVTIHRKYECGKKAAYDCKSTDPQGWELFFNNSVHVGKQISTQRSGTSNFALDDITHEYKLSQ